MRLLEQPPWIPVAQRLAAVVWIAFLAATAATGVFFSVLDPADLKYCVPFPEVSRLAAYTIGFLLFWALTAATAVLAVLFVYPRRPDLPCMVAPDPRTDDARH